MLMSEFVQVCTMLLDKHGDADVILENEDDIGGVEFNEDGTAAFVLVTE